MTGTEGGPAPTAAPDPTEGAGGRSSGAGMPGADRFRALSGPLQLAAVGAAIAGLYGLLRVVDPARFGAEQAGAIIAIAALAVIFLAVGRGRRSATWLPVLAALGVGLLIIAALDLWLLLEDVDDADDYGGGLALPGRIAYFAGAAALAVGAVAAWTAQGGSAASFMTGVTRGQTADRLFAGGALVVVIGWIAMVVLGTGWELALVPGLGIAAAVLGLVAWEASPTGAHPIGSGTYRVVVVALAAIVAWSTIELLGEAIDAWELIVDVAGPLTYLPFIVVVIGAVAMAAGAVMIVMNASSATPAATPSDGPPPG